jgi:hypothetical protein
MVLVILFAVVILAINAAFCCGLGALLAWLVNLSGLFPTLHLTWWQATIVVVIVRLLFGPRVLSVKVNNTYR